MKKKWNCISDGIASPEATSLSDIIAKICGGRGITGPRAIHEFLNPSLIYCHSPFLMKGMHEGVSRIKKAIDSKEKIGIFSDSDLDGITSLVVLHNLLKKFSMPIHIRHLKNDEQYGLTGDIIQEFIDSDVSLLITVDSGTRDINEIAIATAHGIDVIVVDHHEEDSRLPDAIIINPKIRSCGYPYRELAGVGVTFKLCLGLLLSYLPGYERPYSICLRDDSEWHLGIMKNGVLESAELYKTRESFIDALIRYRSAEGLILCADDVIYSEIRNALHIENCFLLTDLAAALNGLKGCKSYNDLCMKLSVKPDLYASPPEPLAMIIQYLQIAGSNKILSFVNESVGLVAIGTIADVVPLLGENRILVSEGFNHLEKTSHPGLSRLINGQKVNARKIGWGIAPLLNAPGRVGKTSLTLNFFMETDEDQLNGIIDEIKSLNDDRRDSVNRICDSLIESSGTSDGMYSNMMVFTSEIIPEGYAGLIANRISDHFEKPVIAISTQGNKEAVKGSGRCRNGIDFFSAVKPFTDEFERIGGHSQAFGFTIKAGSIDAVMIKIDSELQGMNISAMPIIIEMQLPIDAVTTSLAEKIDIMEPFGKDNEVPLFLTKNLRIRSFTRIGNGKHGRYAFKDNDAVSALGWDMADMMQELWKEGCAVDMVYRIEKNTYMGKSEARLVIVDLDRS